MTVLLPLVLIVTHSPVVFGAAKPVPFNPWAVRYGKWGAAMVAAAGPAMNLLLAIFFALWLRFVPVSTSLTPLFIAIISINISFMIFNLIPLPPLDGSRIVYAAFPPIRDLFDRLERQDGLYRNSSDAELFLYRAKPTYIGGIIEMMDRRLYGYWFSRFAPEKRSFDWTRRAAAIRCFYAANIPL